VLRELFSLGNFFNHKIKCFEFSSDKKIILTQNRPFAKMKVKTLFCFAFANIKKFKITRKYVFLMSS